MNTEVMPLRKPKSVIIRRENDPVLQAVEQRQTTFNPVLIWSLFSCSSAFPFEEEMGTHTPKAFVVLAQGYVGRPELIKEIQDFIKQRILPHKCPRHIEVLRNYPS